MSFTINLYRNASSPETISKSITAVGSLTGALKDQSSIIDPNILVQMDTVPSFNYVYIPAFSRYYYVKNITSVRNGLWLIEMHVDVLMSHKSSVLAIPGVCTRQEKIGNLYIPDPERVTENDYFILTKAIGNYFTTNNYILITQ